MFRPVRWCLEHGIDERPDELLCLFVARHEPRRTPNRDREHQRWFRLIRASRAHHQIVDRMVRRLLKRNAHDVPTVAQFTGAIADKQMGEVLHRYLTLEGHAATAGRVGAHPL